MGSVAIITETDLRGIVHLDIETIELVDNAFVALATKRAVMPPIMRLDIDSRSEIDVKTAYIPGLPSIAIKVSPGFFNNPSIGLPSTNGMMMVLSSQTGLVEALLLDNGYLTDVRTAAAGASAAKQLSRADSRVATIFGAGLQARMQLKALTFVRPIEQARIWARDFTKAAAAADELTQSVGIEVVAMREARAAVTGADIIVTTTPATAPILRAEWIEGGQHVTAMGSDAESKNEIDPRLVAMARYVADSASQTRRLGELHHAIVEGLVAAEREEVELGEVIAGHIIGRQSEDEITIADLTGTGVQDTAIASLAVLRARELGVGTAITI